jgi:large subunit ribosomal protein L18
MRERLCGERSENLEWADMKRLDDKRRRRIRRKIGIRKRINGTSERPRVTVYRSNRYTYLQVVDDSKGITLTAASNREKDLGVIKNNTSDIGKLGEALGGRLKQKKIKSVVFDRNGYLYHGIVKSIAEAIRKSGIQF